MSFYENITRITDRSRKFVEIDESENGPRWLIGPQRFGKSSGYAKFNFHLIVCASKATVAAHQWS